MPIILADGDAGNYVVTLERYTPTARFDGLPWTKVQIDESATEAGAITASAIADLDPVDADPTDPQARDFTMVGVTLATGWYRVTFLDDDGNQQPTAWVYNGEATDAQLSPTVTDIAALLRARTRSDDEQIGEELGTFNDRTRPTGTQVQALIQIAVNQLRTDTNVAIPLRFATQAKSLVALNAATLVEDSFTPEQAGVDDWSPATKYAAMYIKGIAALRDAILRPGALRLV